MRHAGDFGKTKPNKPKVESETATRPLAWTGSPAQRWVGWSSPKPDFVGLRKFGYNNKVWTTRPGFGGTCYEAAYEKTPNFESQIKVDFSISFVIINIREIFGCLDCFSIWIVNESVSMVRSNTNNLLKRILLIGDVSKAFLDAETITNERYEVCTNILDAIDIAAKNSFLAIGIILVGVSERLSLALKALREVRPNTKIILLAQIYQEPIAKAIVELLTDGGSLADDYLICPIRIKSFYDSIVPARGHKGAGEVLSTTISSELERRIKLLEKLATEDDLTGLKNRRYIWEFCRQILEHAKKENGRVTLLIFDIDDFKHYNDVYGHSAGDKILKEASILMQRCCRAHDVVGRMGGDEFAVVFWDDPHRGPTIAEVERRVATTEHPKEAIFIAERFRKEFEKAELHFLGPKGEGILTISGGLASFPRDGSTVQELFQKADMALLEAKRSGKNRIYLVGEPKSDAFGIE